MNSLARKFPTPVEITSSSATSIITVDDSIRVEHRYYFKHEVVSQSCTFKVVRISKEIYNSPHHKRPNCFSWVNSCRDANCFFWLYFLYTACNCQNLAFNSSKRFAKVLASYELLSSWVTLQNLEVFCHVAVCIWKAVTKKYCIVVKKKVIGESCGVVIFIFIRLLPNRVFEIRYVITTTMPAYFFVF